MGSATASGGHLEMFLSERNFRPMVRREFLDQSRVPRCVTAGRTLERRHCLPGLHQHRVEVTAASALPSDLHRQLDDRGGDLRQCLNALCPELAGADAASPSLYIRKRGEGELAVKAAFTKAILIRPAVMFGPDGAFLTTMLALLRRLPIYARTSWKPKLVFIVTRLALCVPTIDTPESSFRKRQRGCLGHAATLRYPSPLIKPGVPISGTR